MSDNNRNISEDPNSSKGKGVSGLGKGKQTGPVAGGADNTRGENMPSHQGGSSGSKQGNDNPRQQKGPQSTHANLATTSRGADSTDKEFRNDQPNPSTITDPDMKNKKKNN